MSEGGKAPAPPDRRIHPVIFPFAAGIVLLFVLLGILFPATLGRIFDLLQTSITETFGWFYVLSVTFFLLFVGYLFVSPHGKVKLGKDDDVPEYSRLTWFSMLFSAGMGIGLLFYGVAEPIQHFADPPFGESGAEAAREAREARAEAADFRTRAAEAAEPEEAARWEKRAEEVLTGAQGARRVASEAAERALNLTYFHWGLHAWGIYILMGMALSYFSFRHNLPLNIRSTLYPLLGDRIDGPIGYTVEILAVFGTLFGLAASLGLGAMQINRGAAYLDLFPSSPVAVIAIILVITAAATVSVITGINVGIRRLSQLNLLLGSLLLAFLLGVGPTVFLLSSYVQSLGTYLAELPALTFTTHAYSGSTWQSEWTLFYWGWWISWSPFVGMFVARISRGRTIREFALGFLLVPTLLTFAWITVFGNNALHQELFGAGGMVEAVARSIDTALFQMLQGLPVPAWLTVIATVLAALVIATFFVTSSDSASLVVDILTSGGHPNPSLGTRVFWATMEGTIAAVLVWAGSRTADPEGGLRALQTAAIVTGLPFCFILLLLSYSLFSGLRAERRTGNLSVPYRPVLRAPRETQGESGPFSDWRTRLRRIMADEEDAEESPALHRAHAALQEYFAKTVLPAFDKIREELESSGRTVSVIDYETAATLIVQREGREEFRYSLRGRAFRAVPSIFPELDEAGGERILRVETILRSGLNGTHGLEEWTEEEILDDFLREYAKWRGW